MKNNIHAAKSIFLLFCCMAMVGSGCTIFPDDRNQRFQFAVTTSGPFSIRMNGQLHDLDRTSLQREIMTINVAACPLIIRRCWVHEEMTRANVSDLMLNAEIRTETPVFAAEFRVIRFDAFQRYNGFSFRHFYRDIVPGTPLIYDIPLDAGPGRLYDTQMIAVAVNRCRTAKGIWALDEPGLKQALRHRGCEENSARVPAAVY
jgi:hypothetical protein